MIKKILKKILPRPLLGRLRGFYYGLTNKFTYTEDGLYTIINTDFLETPSFIKSYQIGKSLMQDSWDNYDFRWRAYVLCWAAAQASRLEGDFVECGVNTGMHTRMIIDYIHFESLPKKYYLLDTFTGMSEKYSSPDEMNRSRAMGYTSDIFESVQKSFIQFKNVELIKGPVPETLPRVPSQKISFLSIDMNCVLPEVAALDFFWDRIVNGGIIILDDHGFPGHEEQRNAHYDFARRHNISILPLPTGQGIIIKNS